jgi:RimJ/RimL family protein N-acetyltransferase
MAKRSSKQTHILAVNPKNEDDIIGLLRIRPTGSKSSRSVEVGVDVFRYHRSVGHGGCLFAIACDIAIRRYKPRELSLWVFWENTRAIRIYLKNGFDYDPDTEAKFFFRKGFPTAYVRMKKRVSC